MVQSTKIKSEASRPAMQKQGRVASPVGGLNFINSTMDFPVSDAYVMDNVIPRPYGCEIRKGWRNWMPLANKFGAAVNTMMAFAAERTVYSALFACPAVNPSLVYNVSAQNAAPVLSLTPSTNSDVAGEWYFANYVSQGGNFLLAVAAGAGYYSYSAPAGVGAWIEHVDGAGTGGTIKWPAGYSYTSKDIAFVWMWKNRVWFLIRNSAIAFYLPTGQLSGNLSPFDFGQQLNLGGSLLWAANWTYDSGDGVDDSLVLASTEGQVLVYEGTDPDSAEAFSLKGRWTAGRFPSGRRNFCSYGGDVLFLCEYGLIGVSDLVSGKLHTANLAGSIGYKINPRISPAITDNISSSYWHLIPFPAQELLYMGTPVLSYAGDHQHLGMSSHTNPWCTFSGIDALCAVVYKGQFVFGSSDGTVNQGFYGYQDNVSSDGATLGTEVTGRLQGSFNDYGSPNMNKRMLRIKAYGLSDVDPLIFARFRAEYDVTTPISAPQPGASASAIWDSSLWDGALWAFGAGNGSFHKWFGVNGFGKKMSLQIALRGAGRVIYTDHESLFEEGIGL